MSESQTNQRQAEPTEEEIKAYRASMKKFYEEQIPLLKKQQEYEGLLADIEEAKAKRVSFTLRIAQMLTPAEAPPEGEMPEMEDRPQPETEEPRPERKLRKD